MTARRRNHTAVAKRRASARRPARQHPSHGWPGLIRYALDSNARTTRLCLIILMAGVVLAALLVLRLLLWV